MKRIGYLIGLATIGMFSIYGTAFALSPQLYFEDPIRQDGEVNFSNSKWECHCYCSSRYVELSTFSSFDGKCEGDEDGTACTLEVDDVTYEPATLEKCHNMAVPKDD